MTARKIDTGTKELLCSVENNVATVSFNRAEKRNALGDIVTPALRETLLILEFDSDVRVIVITGVGKAFCAGGDIKGMGNKGNMSDNRSLDEKIDDLQRRQNTLTLRLYELPKPTIAALPGAAAGAGMSIALACDIRIGTKNAFYASGYGLVGLSGDYGGSWQLTKLVGPAKAKEIFYTGRRIKADEALQLGLLNEVVEQEHLQTRTKELASQIANGPPIAIQYMKENINLATQADFKECLNQEADRLVRTAQTADHKEAVQAFIEKREPVFKGN